MDETVHELLLRLAGRVDDELLADAREFVAVGEDGHAVELVTAALAADRAPLPSALRAELVAAARGARIDMDADAALAAEGLSPTEHRFSPWAAPDAVTDADSAVHDAVRELPDRLLTGVRLRLAWRWTPAGSAPTPLPSPVLLVEAPEGGRPGEVLAYQVREGLRRSGVLTAVEVLTSGRPLTAYHAAALRASVAIDVEVRPTGAEPPVAPPVAEPTGAASVNGVAADHRVVEDVLASSPPVPFGSAATSPADDRLAGLFGEDDPAPRPVAMRSWQSGRRRRAFVEPAQDARPVDESEVALDSSASGGSVGAAAAEPLPTPVPLARRRPAPTAWSAAQFGAPTSTDSPADPLAGPLAQPLLDPVLDAASEQAPPADVATGEDDPEGAWAAGDFTQESWGVTEPVRRSGREAPPVDEPEPGQTNGVEPGRADDADEGPSAADVGSPVEELPVGEPGSPDQPALLKPESVARLNDADRHLLARLQAELQAEPTTRPEQVAPRGRRSGAHALRTTDEEPYRTGELPVSEWDAATNGASSDDLRPGNGSRAGGPPNLAG